MRWFDRWLLAGQRDAWNQSVKWTTFDPENLFFGLMEHCQIRTQENTCKQSNILWSTDDSLLEWNWFKISVSIILDATRVGARTTMGRAKIAEVRILQKNPGGFQKHSKDFLDELPTARCSSWIRMWIEHVPKQNNSIFSTANLCIKNHFGSLFEVQIRGNSGSQRSIPSHTRE